MAAAQCCTSKCTAERKGFRRELDSWRHKLIHCVGFESILEGIYGPMLLRDLSIFDDCEPEELDNWSMDASCSFCNLQLDKLNDHVAAASSPLSSPSDDATSQAPPLLDSNQSAHRFLHAVLHKKDVPSSISDHHLPLVAQELMRKMIHQFALEYASKGPLYGARNGLTSAGADTGSPLPDRTDPDAPLDLTVSRHQENQGKEPQPDGVLDLSKRTSACSATSQSSTNQEASGSPLPPEDPQREAEDSRTEDSGMLRDTLSGRGGGRDSALQAVLRSLCPAHRSLLRQILSLAYREHRRSSSSCSHHHRLAQAQPQCCHQVAPPQDSALPPPLPLSDGKPHSRAPHYPFTDCSGQAHSGPAYLSLDCTAHGSAHSFAPRDCQSQAAPGSGCCCVQSCRVAATYPVGAVCFCLKSLHCLSCPSLAIGRINKVVCTLASASTSLSPTLCSTAALCTAPSACPASAVCCSHHNPHPCPCYSEGAYLARVRHTAEGVRDPQCPVLKRERTRSPSPPPLSPIPSDIHEKAEEKPPSLLHHRDEGDNVPPKVQDLHRRECEGQRAADDETDVKDDPECMTPEKSGEEQIASRSSLQDMVDRFSEKLETIKPQEKELPPSSLSASHGKDWKDSSLGCPFNQSLASQVERDHHHLSEIITKVLHTGNDSDYNLSELFHRHDNSETQSPKTRSRRRQEALAAMTADQLPTRRQTLQIKRELARLDQTLCGKKLPFGRSGRLKDGRAVTFSTSNSSSETSPVKGEIEGIGEERQPERKKEEWEKAEFGEQDLTDRGTEKAMTGEMEERRTEREKVEKSEISESGGMKGGQEGEVAKEGEMTEFSEEWHTVDEGGRSSATEEIEAVIVTEEVKMELVMAEAGEETVTVKKARSPDNQTPTIMQQQNNPTETQIKHEAETLSCSEACDHSHTDILRRRKDSFAPLHGDDEALVKGSGQLERGQRGRKARPVSVSGNSTETGRSRRNIVPPQRFSSYVTEPRKMYFAACFSESIFSQRTPKDKPLAQDESGGLDSQTVREDSQEASVEHLQIIPQSERQESDEIACECRPEGSESRVVQVTVAAGEGSPPKHSSLNRTDVRDSAARPYGRLRSPIKESKSASKSPKKPSRQDVSTTENTASPGKSRDTQPQYTSPIKLMFVSQVVGEAGVKYTLKSAASDSIGQGEEMFDPCEETSWAGTPEKTTSLPADCIAPSPKRSSTKSGEGSPPKQAVGSDTQKSPGSPNGGGAERQDGLLPLHETTPPKRRPGRPKKLGPQLEKRAKRPIGRPPKQKCLDQTRGPGTNGSNAVNEKGAPGSHMEDKANKNLKITVVYGRSRRSKRLVSEDSGRLQTDTHEAPHAESRNGQLDKNNLFQSSQVSAVTVKDFPPELAEDLNFVRPVKERKVAPHSSSNIKCQKLQGAAPLRKPGRPAKVKISGISVTVTTVSPRQRKIHMNRDTRESPQKIRKKLLSPEFQPSKEPRTISALTCGGTQIERAKDSLDGSTERQMEPERPVPVRHSVRVRKPSVYLLHSVATSRSYSHSTALLRRSRQLLLSRASSQRKQQEEVQGGLGEASGEKSHPVVGLAGRRNDRKQACQDLRRVAGVSVDSIFPPSDNVRWWVAATQEETLNQELARRIRLLSDTWISDTTDKQGGMSLKSRASVRANGSSAKRPAPTSMVKMLFNCPPSKPRSCSMDQLCSWFMQTTETQSLAIVKKASTRNPYEDMHYPRATNRGSICPSLQSERLRKHVKKFAKAVPKSPTQHRQAQERLWSRNKLAVKRQLFASRLAPGRLSQRAPKGRVMGKYLNTLLRVKSKFLTRRERVKRPKRQRNNLMAFVRQRIRANHLPKQANSPLPTVEPFSSAMDHSFESSENIWLPSPARLTEELVDIPKEQRLSSKAWSPETLKECRVFLKKINSPDTESTAEEEWDTCTVTLDDGSPPTYCPNERRAEVREREEDKAVNIESKKKRRRQKSTTKESICSPPKEIRDQAWLPAGKRKSKQSLEKVSSESLNPPPAKVTRLSRGRGLTGPRWSDFVLGSSK